MAATSRFVEPASANMACYSVEFARILLTAGSEVDVLCKVLCQEHRLPVRPTNINGYRAAITGRFPGFTKLEILVPRYDLIRLPWPQMLTLDPQRSSDIRTNLRPGHVLPDFTP